MEMMATMMPFTSAAFLRLQPERSMVQARMFSNTATMVEKEAKLMNRKNRVPHTRPAAMELNTLGRVMKISGGPLSTGTS